MLEINSEVKEYIDIVIDLNVGGCAEKDTYDKSLQACLLDLAGNGMVQIEVVDGREVWAATKRMRRLGVAAAILFVMSSKPIIGSLQIVIERFRRERGRLDLELISMEAALLEFGGSGLARLENIRVGNAKERFENKVWTGTGALFFGKYPDRYERFPAFMDWFKNQVLQPEICPHIRYMVEDDREETFKRYGFEVPAAVILARCEAMGDAIAYLNEQGRFCWRASNLDSPLRKGKRR